MGLGLQGAYGAAGGQDELEKIVADRIKQTLLKQAAEQQQAELALKTRGLDIDERQGDARIGLEGQRVGFEGQRVGLDKDKFGFEQQQWGDLAPQREANVAHTGAQTGEILRQPAKEAADRAHDGTMLDKRGTWNLREIGAGGAEDRRTLGMRQGFEQSMASQAAAAKANPQLDAEAQDTLREVNRISTALRDHSGRGGAFGLLQSKLPTMRQGTADAETLLKSLQGLLTLENMGKMKGVLSDKDMQVLRQASTTLSGEMSDEASAAELDRLIASSGGRQGAKVGDVKTFPNGKQARFDGKGWVQIQ
jgi:hypothetical protein